MSARRRARRSRPSGAMGPVRNKVPRLHLLCPPMADRSWRRADDRLGARSRSPGRRLRNSPPVLLIRGAGTSVLKSAFGASASFPTTLPNDRFCVAEQSIIQLTANISSAQIPGFGDNLFRPDSPRGFHLSNAGDITSASPGRCRGALYELRLSMTTRLSFLGFDPLRP